MCKFNNISNPIIKLKMNTIKINFAGNKNVGKSTILKCIGQHYNGSIGPRLQSLRHKMVNISIWDGNYFDVRRKNISRS